jgi:DNA repair protein RadC
MQPELFESPVLFQQRPSDAATIATSLTRARHATPEEVAEKVIGHFGTAGRAFAASETELLRIPGMTRDAVDTMNHIRDVAISLLSRDAKTAPVLSNWVALLDYLRASVGHLRTEEARVLYLDRRNRIIADESLSRGTVDHCPVYVREVIRRALQVDASALILVHNHPSGDPSPSQADITMTKKLQDAAAAVDITLHDHVIVTQDEHTSFRSAGLL